MRAIVIATGENKRLLDLNDRNPAPMLTLVDRPFLQHILELLLRQGVTRFDFVLSHLPQKIENHFGDGTRWGTAIRFHLASDPARPYRLVSVICADSPEPVLLVHADRLPRIDLSESRERVADSPLLFCAPGTGGGPPEWTGWAWLPGPCARNWDSDLDETELAARLLGGAGQNGGHIVDVPQVLSIRSCEDYLRSQEAVLRKQSAELLLVSREIEPGIWMDRNVSLHPTARIEPPVSIGENCRIGRGVHLGPNVVISRDCVVDEHSRVVDSLVLPGSYVGESLELDHVIVDRNRLLNVALGTSVTVTDTFLLGSLAQGSVSASLRGIVSRLLALALLLAAWPVWLLTALFLAVFRKGPAASQRQIVKLPAVEEPEHWKTGRLTTFRSPSAAGASSVGPGALLLDFLPALPSVARGDLRFVGVAPRSPEEVRALPPDWRALYLRSKAGIITEALVQQGPQASEEDLYSAEVFYAATGGFTHDAALVLGYLRRIYLGR